MCELTLLFVRAETVFHEFLAELALLFVLMPAIVRVIMRMFSGSVSKVARRLRGISRSGRVAGLVEALSIEVEGIFLDELPAGCSHVSVDKLLLINLLVGN